MPAALLDSIEVPTDYSVLSDEQLGELDEVARTAAAPLVEKAAGEGDVTDAELADLDALSGIVTSVREERERRVNELADQAASQADKAGRRSRAVATFQVNDGPKVAPEKVSAPTVAQVASAATDGPDKDGGAVEEEGRSSYTKAYSAINTPRGKQYGQEFTDLDDMALSLEHAMASFGVLPPGTVQRQGVIQLRREYPESLRIDSRDSRQAVMRKFDAVGRDQHGPDGASLVAAAGWCAPSEILYDLFEPENGTDGIVDAPELQIHRGGVQVTPGPDFSTIFGGAGYWHQTEAQVIAATSKPTMSIACPTFTDNRLEVEGVQITGAFLQDRGYPELVARFTRGAMRAHQRKLNMFFINKVVNGSVTFDYTNVANLPVTETEYKDLSSLNRILGILGIQIMDYRYKFRLGFNDLVEVWLPFWALEQVRADVQRRTGIDDPDSVLRISMQQVSDWASIRGARIQWLYDWQDAYNVPGSGTNTSTTLGQTAGVYQLPKTLYAEMYATGTWVRGVADVIRLDTVYDSTNLALNQYIALFTEDGIQAIKRGFESRLIKMTIDPSGTLSATSNMVTG